MQTIKQIDTWSCYGCAAAMVTGETLQDVIDFVGHDGSGYDEEAKHPEKKVGFRNYKIDRYLFSRGYSLAQFYLFLRVDVVGKKGILGGVDLDCPLLISVRSGGWDHIIYWDGKRVHDPSPHSKDLPVLKDYNITHFIPIYKYPEREIEAWRRVQGSRGT